MCENFIDSSIKQKPDHNGAPYVRELETLILCTTAKGQSIALSLTNCWHQPTTKEKNIAMFLFRKQLSKYHVQSSTCMSQN